MARYNFGPALVDFAPLANIGKSYQSAFDAQRKRALEDERRQTFASLGSSSAPDYTKTGLALLGMGDVASGAALIGLGEKAQERKLEAEAIRSWSGGAPSAAPASTPSEGGVSPSLIQNESGGRWDAKNDAVGAGGQKGHFGRLQFGQARLQEAQAAGVIPPGTTPQAFMQSPELQQRAEQWHFADIDQSIKQNGFDRLVGQRLNGVPVTVEGMRAVAHLGGKEGLRKFIETGGQYNPADENGTRLSDYFTRHGGGGAQPTRVAAPAMPVQVAENEADVQRLEAQQGNPQVGGGTYAQSPTAELQAFLQNPRVPDNMKAMMQEELARRSGGQAPVQMAQAAPQPGSPVADVPAQGASPAQGFAVPQAADVPASIAQDPKVQLWSQRLASSTTERMRTVAKQQLDLAVKDAEQRMASSKPTDVQRNYQLARSQGYQGSLLDYQKELRAQTNVNMPPVEKEYDKQSAKDFAEMNRDLIKGSQAANQKIATLDRLQKLLSDPNVRTGAGAQLALQAARLGKSVFGIETEGLGGAEAVNAIANQFALELRNPTGGAGMPGALSDKDREFLQQSTPGLERTPEGNSLIIDYMRRINQRSVEIDRLRRDYIKQNRRLDEGFFDKLADFSEKNPLFPEANGDAAPPVPGSAPKRGVLEDGFRFKGGDPSDPKNWHKVR